MQKAIASLVYRDRPVRSGGNWQLVVKVLAGVSHIDLPRCTDPADRPGAIKAAEDYLFLNYRADFLEEVERNWPALASDVEAAAGAPVDLAPVDRAVETMAAATEALRRSRLALEAALTAALDGSARIPSGVEALLLDALRGIDPDAAARFLPAAPGADWTVG